MLVLHYSTNNSLINRHLQVGFNRQTASTERARICHRWHRSLPGARLAVRVCACARVHALPETCYFSFSFFAIPLTGTCSFTGQVLNLLTKLTPMFALLKRNIGKNMTGFFHYCQMLYRKMKVSMKREK